MLNSRNSLSSFSEVYWLGLKLTHYEKIEERAFLNDEKFISLADMSVEIWLFYSWRFRYNDIINHKLLELSAVN